MKKVLALEPSEIDLIAAAVKEVGRFGNKQQQERCRFLYLEIVRQHSASDGALKVSSDYEGALLSELQSLHDRIRALAEKLPTEDLRYAAYGIANGAMNRIRGDIA